MTAAQRLVVTFRPQPWPYLVEHVLRSALQGRRLPPRDHDIMRRPLEATTGTLRLRFLPRLKLRKQNTKYNTATFSQGHPCSHMYQGHWGKPPRRVITVQKVTSRVSNFLKTLAGVIWEIHVKPSGSHTWSNQGNCAKYIKHSIWSFLLCATVILTRITSMTLSALNRLTESLISPQKLF